MSISHLQAKLDRLNAKIEDCQAQLTQLKAQRKELKDHLEEAKNAAKHGEPPPAEPEPEGLVETITATVNEAVVAPLTRLMSPKSGKPGRPNGAEKKTAARSRPPAKRTGAALT